MDEKILNIIFEHRKLFVPNLFTSKQVDILHKYSHQETLNNTEKAYLYSAIKRKIDALQTLREEFYIIGNEMLPERVEKAKKMLKEINQPKAFISGSFLFNKKYNDIDVYIVGEHRRSYHKGKTHFTTITEKDLRNPLFVSAARYSVATFRIVTKPLIKREAFGEIFFTYQWIINQILEKEDQKEIRNIVFQYYLQVQQKILDAHELDLKFKEVKALPDDKKIQEVNRMTKEILLATHSKKYLSVVLSTESRAIQKMSLEYKTNDNLLIYIKLLEEVKNECRRD